MECPSPSLGGTFARSSDSGLGDSFCHFDHAIVQKWKANWTIIYARICCKVIYCNALWYLAVSWHGGCL
jgi:hypothetical protein